ncbi:hypothetical protein PI125_g23337 [Phytophthora idaei]|nr:hypothetical protein PI125_g23337 [Phytophthora idaei]
MTASFGCKTDARLAKALHPLEALVTPTAGNILQTRCRHADIETLKALLLFRCGKRCLSAGSLWQTAASGTASTTFPLSSLAVRYPPRGSSGTCVWR